MSPAVPLTYIQAARGLRIRVLHRSPPPPPPPPTPSPCSTFCIQGAVVVSRTLEELDRLTGRLARLCQGTQRTQTSEIVKCSVLNSRVHKLVIVKCSVLNSGMQKLVVVKFSGLNSRMQKLVMVKFSVLISGILQTPFSVQSLTVPTLFFFFLSLFFFSFSLCVLKAFHDPTYHVEFIGRATEA